MFIIVFQVEEHRYPFTGKSNVQVTIGIIDLRDENKQQTNIHWIDLSSFDDFYIARVQFFPDHSLAIQIENRQQTKLQLYQYDFLKQQKLKLLVEETSQSWINLHDLFYTLKKTPTQFIWASERSGYMHIELRDYQTGHLIRTLTDGKWVVQRIVDIDETNSIIYFLANRETPVEVHLYRIDYNDPTASVDRITQEPGCHGIYCFNRTYEYCVTQWNSIDQHPIIRLIDVKTKQIVQNLEHLYQGELQNIEQFHFVKPQLMQIQNRDNDTLYAALYKPDETDHRYQKPYPTLVSVYGGPHVQRYVRTKIFDNDMR
jgi:dipeptidyl-peptidase 4